MALKGIVIDPGHGGTDPGAVSNGLKEKDFTLRISKYMYDRLKELGVPVRLTRDSDVTLTPKERVNKVQSFFGDSKDVVVVSNHLNAGGGDGAEVIYALRNNSTLSKKILNELEKEGQNVRKYYQQRLPSNPIKDYYFMQRNTPNNETITVEYGFIDSPKDDIEQIEKNYKNYVEAVIRALADYKGFKYTPPLGSDYYIVKKGDSLWSIANKYGITVKELKEINKLTSNTLKVGQTLKLTKNNEMIPEDYLVYKVKKGDSLWDIAKEYNTTVDTLKKINNLSNGKLTVNQQLFIPKNDNSSVKNTGEINYVVQKGDNLWTIANKYDTTISDIKKLNNLKTNTLQIGQVLKIPGSTNYNTYTVKKGDSLWKIADKYGTTVNKLMTINNLDSTTLQIGQSLLIPTN
ncbi:LysM peptidoglycan-binding domain-containing protein [Holdemanella sp. SCCA2]|nr:LysM peptidoglycan-binding domain-containing protein [Holdemanella sp. SCCA2]